jgi:hypothetical protein
MVAGPSWASSHPSELTEEQQQIMRIRNSSSTYVARPDILLLTDAWGGHSGARYSDQLREHGIQSLPIPKHTTATLQPLDVTFFRQYKKFWKMISAAALHLGMVQEITSRAGVINMHSLMWDQFGSPRYRDMLLWAWRHTDPGFTHDELEHGHPPAMVDDIQFDLGRNSSCAVEGCKHAAFVRCSHCGKMLCLRHFLDRTCFHHRNETAAQSLPTTSTTSRPDDSSDGSGGSAGSAGIAVGAVAGVAGASVVSGSAIASSVATGSAVVAGGITIGQTINAVKPTHQEAGGSRQEKMPLIGYSAARPEEVFIQHPSFNFKELVRDDEQYVMPSRIDAEPIEVVGLPELTAGNKNFNQL